MLSVLFIIEKWLSNRPNFLSNLMWFLRNDVDVFLLTEKIPSGVVRNSYKTIIPAVEGKHMFDFIGVVYRLLFTLLLFISTMRLVKKNNIDIIHTDIPVCCIPSFLVATILRRKVVISVRAFAGKRWFSMVKSSFKASLLYLLETTSLKLPYDKIVPAGRNFLNESKEFGIDPKRIAFLTPNTVNMKRFNPKVNGRNFKKEHNIGENDIVVLFISPIDRTTGAFYLLDAFKELHRMRPNSKLVFVGPGQDSPIFREEIIKEQLEDAVILAGELLHTEMPEVIASADIYVRPSLTEGLPMAILEALACAKAVIATDVGGTSEIIINRKTGLLIDPKDTKKLVTCLLELFDDKHLRKSLGEQGQNFVESRYTIEKVKRDYLNLYKELISNR